MRARYYVAQQRWDELVGLGWEQVREPLLESLHNGGENFSRRVAKVLGRVGGGRAVEPLILVLKNEVMSMFALRRL